MDRLKPKVLPTLRVATASEATRLLSTVQTPSFVLAYIPISSKPVLPTIPDNEDTLLFITQILALHAESQVSFFLRRLYSGIAQLSINESHETVSRPPRTMT